MVCNRFAPGHVKLKAASGHVTSGYWGCVSGLEGAFMLRETSPNFNGEEYVELLEDSFLPAIRAVRPGEVITLVQDNAPWHTARVVTDFLHRQRNVEVSVYGLETSSRYYILSSTYHSRHVFTGAKVAALLSDLNIVENVWGHMIMEWDCRREPTSEALQAHVRDSWGTFERRPNMISNMARSMPRRLAAVIEAQGGHIKY